MNKEFQNKKFQENLIVMMTCMVFYRRRYIITFLYLFCCLYISLLKGKAMRYAVFGQPVSHSRSPQIHQLFAKEEGAQIIYSKEAPEIPDFEKAIFAFQQAGGLGANVTVPFKERAYELAHELTDRAQAAGAVNTLIFKENALGEARIVGDNTDGAGLVWDITQRLSIDLLDKRILVIGAGGATKGILLPLLGEKPKEIVICNRTFSKALALAEKFGVVAKEMTDLKTDSFDVVINASSAGLSQTLPDVPSQIFNRALLAYDLVYGEYAQNFLSWAQENGADKVADGLGMLVGQAAESYFQWRGFRPQVSPVIAALAEG